MIKSETRVLSIGILVKCNVTEPNVRIDNDGQENRGRDQNDGIPRRLVRKWEIFGILVRLC